MISSDCVFLGSKCGDSILLGCSRVESQDSTEMSSMEEDLLQVKKPKIESGFYYLLFISFHSCCFYFLLFIINHTEFDDEDFFGKSEPQKKQTKTVFFLSLIHFISFHFLTNSSD